MDATFVTSVYVILDEIVKATLEPVKDKPKMTPAEILLVAVVAARYFHNNLERRWCSCNKPAISLQAGA